MGSRGDGFAFRGAPPQGCAGPFGGPTGEAVPAGARYPRCARHAHSGRDGLADPARRCFTRAVKTGPKHLCAKDKGRFSSLFYARNPATVGHEEQHRYPVRGSPSPATWWPSRGHRSAWRVGKRHWGAAPDPALAAWQGSGDERPPDPMPELIFSRVVKGSASPASRP